MGIRKRPEPKRLTPEEESRRKAVLKELVDILPSDMWVMYAGDTPNFVVFGMTEAEVRSVVNSRKAARGET
jgi:hypothetical protein